MNPFLDFEIPFTGLSIGNHHYELEVNDTFFSQFEYSRLHKGHLNVSLELEKKERMLTFFFRISGIVSITCDRCGGEFNLPLQGDEHLIVKFGEEYAEESYDMIVIPENDHKINLAPFIYEYIHLLLPARIIHPDDDNGKSTCDPEMLRKLQELSQHHGGDARWDVLRNLNDETNN